MECLDDAFEFLKQSSSPLALFYQGNCRFEQANYQMAVHYYEESLSVEKENAACWNNLGVSYLKLGKKPQADQSFSKAISLKPDYNDPKRYTFTRRELRKDLLPYSK